MRTLFLTFCALSLVVAPLEAQRQAKAPKRPKLAAGADTNDANAYLQHGHKVIETNADAAMVSYYWASRLNPASADALYSLRIATLMRRISTFHGYMEGVSRTVFSKEMQANDSLYYRALQIDPFLHPRHERTVLLHYYRTAIGDGVNPGEIDFYVERRLNAAPPSVRARMAVASGQLGYALELYTEAISAAKDPMYLYLERGKLNAMQGLQAAALEDYAFGIAKLKERDLKKENVVVFYASKALHEHSIGLLHARAGDADKAREAFGRAMEEDLAFYPAHLALARLAMATHDTVTATSEAALAADLAPGEPYVHFIHGQILANAGQHADAIAPLRRASELEPFYAEPTYQLGVSLQAIGDTAGATAAFERFLALAPARSPQRVQVNTLLKTLGGTR
jgi:tetratricopeptide (TPR) repeat protein